MSIESRKIEFVQEFLKLQSEKSISKFEKILKTENKHSANRKVESISANELNVRIDKSLKDSKNGRLTEVNDLLTEIDKWS